MSKSQYCCSQTSWWCNGWTLGKVHAVLHDFNDLLLSTSTLSQELEKRLKFFILLTLHGLLDDYSHVHVRFWDLLLCSILLPLVSSFCVCQVNKPLIYLLPLMANLLFWYLSMMIAITLVSCAKGVSSVTIVASFVMLYFTWSSF